MKIQLRLLLLMLSMITVTMITAFLVTSYLTRDSVETAALEKLAAVTEARYSALSRWVNSLQAQITVLATTPTTVSLLHDLSREFDKLGSNAQTLLQQNYLATIHDAPMAQVSASIAGYDKVNRSALPYFSRQREVNYWYDVLLIDSHGNVVFSLKKEADFATNLRTGPWRDSGLARAVMPLLKDAIPGQLSFADYEHYAPSNLQAASFIAMPIFDQENQLFLGVVAMQLPIATMSELMMDKTGMGQTGEVIVVGKEGWMLTDSRFSQNSTILKIQIKTEASAEVLSGKTATVIAPDYRGNEIIARVKPFTPFASALGDKALWGIIAKIEHAEILSAYHAIQRALLWVTIGLILLALSLGIWGARTITRPLTRISDALTRLAKGEDINIPELYRTDEIGDIAKAAETFHSIAGQVEYEHWLSENVSLLTSAVSAESSVKKAAERILHLLCTLLDVPVGAVYLLEAGRYQRISSHGLARSNQAETCFEPGVGLLGQCAQSNQALVLSPVPDGLTIISTGLAEFSPDELIIYPIEHKNEVLALVELAAINSLSNKQHAFLKAASAVLGLYFANLQAAEHNSLLLVETRQQAAELLASSGYARSLLEASLDPLVTIGVDGKIMDVNAATEKVTGTERNQLIGSYFCDYFTEPDKARMGYQQVFSSGFITDYPLIIRHANGNITDVLYNASVYRDSQGEVAGIFAAARDITDKKKADQIMQEQQQSLQRSNEEMQTITEELRSQSEEMKSQNEELKSSQEELRAQQEEVTLKNKALEKQSQQLKEVITEARIKADELQQANQYKSEFLANMSHELRTPLNSILILSKSLAENDGQNLSKDQIESASVISESGTQLLTLINDILDLSKIEAGKLELNKEAFSLNDLAAYLRRVFLPQIEIKKLTLEMALAAHLPEHVYTDRQRLTQVLSNLLTNAIKFTDSGTVNVLFSQIDDDLQIEVIDSGIGIPPDKLEHIFGAFQQL